MREIAFGAALALIVAAATLLTAARPVAGRPVLSLFPARSSPAQIMAAIAAADGRALLLGLDQPVAVSIGDGPGYVASLYRAGAWLVADAAFAKLCFRLKDSTESRT